MKKLLLCTPIYPPDIGGPATYTSEICKRLANEYEISVLTYGNADAAPVFPKTKLYIIKNTFPLPLRLILYTLKLFFIARKVDIIYVQNAVAAGFPVFLLSKILRKKYILKFVGDEAWERATQTSQTNLFIEKFQEEKQSLKLSLWIRTLIFIQGITLRGASIVTTPSFYLGKSLVKNYGVKSENFRVNYNASETTNKNTDINTGRKQHQILTVARLTKWKCVGGIVRAVKILVPKYKDLKLVICGDGPELENLKKLTKNLDLENNVSFLGKVPHTETFRLRNESQVFVLNSTYEGLPHTVLHSFEAKIPVIATNISGTNETVYDKETGLLVEANNEQDLASKIEMLFEDENLRQQIIAGGTKILHEKFSWETHLSNLRTFFKEISY